MKLKFSDFFEYQFELIGLSRPGNDKSYTTLSRDGYFKKKH